MRLPEAIAVTPSGLDEAAGMVAGTARAIDAVRSALAAAQPPGALATASAAAQAQAAVAWISYLDHLTGRLDGFASGLRRAASAYAHSDATAGRRLRSVVRGRWIG